MKRILSVIISLLFVIGSVVPSAFASDDGGFYDRLASFSNKLYALAAEGEDKNYAMSPLSVYLALAMLHFAGDDGVKREIEDFTGMSADDFALTSTVVNDLSERSPGAYGGIVSELSLSDTVWFDENVDVNMEELYTMMYTLGCYGEKVPFARDNDRANRIVKEFVRNMTNGLIDRNFNFDTSTLFALVNTLYLKAVWNPEGELYVKPREFTTSSGDKKTLDFANGFYIPGEAGENDYCTFFYVEAANGYKMKLILPKEGVTLKEAMSKSSLDEVNSYSDYDKNSTENVKHFTRCAFPEFKIESPTPLMTVLKADGTLAKTLGSGFTSKLVKGTLAVSDIQHHTVLNVDRIGIEGAAVTSVSVAGSAYDDTVKIYHEFVADREFGYIITTRNDVILFEGQVTDPAPNVAPTVVAGDANGDGELTVKDVLLIRRVIAGLAKLNPVFEERARISGGNDVCAKDVLKMRRIIAGLE